MGRFWGRGRSGDAKLGPSCAGESPQYAWEKSPSCSFIWMSPCSRCLTTCRSDSLPFYGNWFIRVYRFILIGWMENLYAKSLVKTYSCIVSSWVRCTNWISAGLESLLAFLWLCLWKVIFFHYYNGLPHPWLGWYAKRSHLAQKRMFY